MSDSFIESNSADGSGGGVFIASASALAIAECGISDNIAGENGGGFYLDGGAMAGSGLNVEQNSAMNNGGGAAATNASSISLSGSVMDGNSSFHMGGAVRVSDDSEAEFVNCLVTGNSARFNGGAFHVENAVAAVFNVTAANNTADYGGALFAIGSATEATVTNAIFWNNGDEISDPEGRVQATFSDIEMPSDVFAGTGNINAEPKFRDPLDNFRLEHDSPCIEAGTDADAPDDDLDGNPRPYGALWDMGSYEWNDTVVQAYFTAVPTVAYTGQDIQFTDLSHPADDIVEWSWDFGDDGPLDNTRNPVHQYGQPGVYTVTLTVRESDDDAFSYSRNGYVTIKGDAPTADFDARPKSGYAPLSVQFEDESTTPSGVITDWSWDFGDGGTSDSQHPEHIYEEPGTYTVKLEVENAAGEKDSRIRYQYVEVHDKRSRRGFRRRCHIGCGAPDRSLLRPVGLFRTRRIPLLGIRRRRLRRRA